MGSDDARYTEIILTCIDQSEHFAFGVKWKRKVFEKFEYTCTYQDE